MKGILYIVATPIGNLADLSSRAIKVLQSVQLIAAEDTRHSAYLLQHFNIATRTISLHQHNEQQRSEQLLSYLQQGQSIALISDAGTPIISDPGQRLVQQLQQADIKIVPIPGPCALITALSASGLAGDSFRFAGFLPAKSNARQKCLAELQDETSTLIFYEAPHRIRDLLTDLLSIFGHTRYGVIARELTKTFETIHGGTLEELNEWLASDSNQQKGEFVVLIKGKDKAENTTPDPAVERILDLLLTELSVKQAISLTTKITGAKKNQVYELALSKNLTSKLV